MDPTLLFALVLVGAICQLVAMLTFWYRFGRLLRTQEPPNTLLIIHSFSAQTDAIARSLARYTRLDLSEIDELLEEHRTGPLPLRLSARQARLLAAELRRLGVEAEVSR